MSWEYWTPEPEPKAKADITIPPEVVEAGARAIAESLRTARLTTEAQDGYKPEARAACIAMLQAWPGMFVNGDDEAVDIILPMTQQASDDQ